MSISYLNIAGVFVHIGELDKVVEYAKRSFDKSSDFDFPQVKMHSAYQLAEIYSKVGKDSLALIYADTTIACSKSLGSSFGVFKAKSIQATIALNQNNYEKSLELEKEISDFYKDGGFQLEYLIVSNREAKLLIMLGRYSSAEKVIESNIELANQLQSKEQLAIAYQSLAVIQASLSKHDEAYESLKKYMVLNAEILGIEKKTLTELETKYETEKKEAEIASLSQQAAIQALEIQQKNQLIFLVIAIVLIVMIVVLLFYRDRSNKRNRVKVELEQRFLRSQLNPHFISNALLAVQNFMLKNEAGQAAIYLSKFSKLMREILENSRQEFISVEEEVDMLKNYLDIHQLRMNNSFDYIIELSNDIDLEMDMIPPMMIQPFVENSIEHGIADLDRKGEIHLSFDKDEEFVIISLKDNGNGFIEKIGEVAHNSLSTKIIKERIDIFNRSLKKKIQFKLDSILDEDENVKGTKILLKVPFN
ncbi:MAG: histidine kinase [Reichenbachiella sp.]